MQPDSSIPFATSAMHRSTSAIDAEARLKHDVSCRACGYNLRGLLPSASCPECRAPVAQSIRGDLLVFSDPKWLDRLSLGALLVVVTGLAGFFVTITNGVLAARLFGTGIVSAELVKAIAAGLSFCLAAVHWSGFWLLTSPDPASEHDEPFWSARSGARYGTLSLLLAAPLQQMSDFKTAFTINPNVAVSMSARLLGFGLVVATCMQLIGQTAMFIHGGRLARRIPDVGLANQTTAVMWGFIITQAISIVSLACLYWAMPRLGGNTSAIPVFIFMSMLLISCVAKPVGFVFDVWALVLLFLYRSRFAWVAERAKTIWSAPVAGQ